MVKQKIKPHPAHKPLAGKSLVKHPGALHQPVIGIIGLNAPKFSDSHGLFLQLIQERITAQGGRPVLLSISGSSDSQDRDPLALHYSLPSRDIVASQIEMLVHEEGLEGLVMVPCTVHSLVGMLMASVRCGLPTVFLPYYGVWPFLMQRQTAEIKQDQSLEPSYAQYSMLVLLEVLGFTKIGTLERWFKDKKSFVPEKDSSSELSSQMNPLDKEINDFIIWGGQRIVEMAKQKVFFKKFLCQSSLNNAICVDMALGGSPEAALHLGALAATAELTLPRTIYNDISKKISQSVSMNHSGEFTLHEFQRWGGLNALLGSLYHLIQPSPTVQGKSLNEVAKEQGSLRSPFRQSVIDRKVQIGTGVLFGNLAREGALFRVSGLKQQWLAHSGPAKIFSSQKACEQAILAKKIKKGDVIVLRYCGPRGAPGMPCLQLREVLKQKGLDDSVMIITDGRVDVLGKTPSIVHLAPEAGAGGTLAIIQDGDVISWNFAERSLMVRLTETEIRVRLSRWKEQQRPLGNNFLNQYSKHASSAAHGAALI